MSVAEMKVKAFEKLAVINDEAALKEILIYLEKLSQAEKEKIYNLSKHFDAISQQYDETLKKLAQ
jgi:hypothetical protein